MAICNLGEAKLKTMPASRLVHESGVLQDFAGAQYFYSSPVEVKSFACVTFR